MYGRRGEQSELRLPYMGWILEPIGNYILTENSTSTFDHCVCSKCLAGIADIIAKGQFYSLPVLPRPREMPWLQPYSLATLVPVTLE